MPSIPDSRRTQYYLSILHCQASVGLAVPENSTSPKKYSTILAMKEIGEKKIRPYLAWVG